MKYEPNACSEIGHVGIVYLVYTVMLCKDLQGYTTLS